MSMMIENEVVKCASCLALVADNDFEAGRGSLIPSCCAWQAAVEQAGLVFIEY